MPLNIPAWSMALGLAGALSMLFAQGPFLSVTGLALAIAAAAAIASTRLKRHIQARQALRADSTTDGAHAARYLDGLRAVCRGALPRWSRHVELCRVQTGSAAVGLVREFNAISQTLGQALAAARKEGRGAEDVAALIETARAELGNMLTDLKGALEAKQGLLAEISKLAQVTKDLRSMVDDVASLAHQTNLLAINAAIEAARVGDAGRGFAVVAGEVRTLSNRSADTGRAIRDKINVADRAMALALDAARQTAERDRLLVTHCDATIGAILRRFSQQTATLLDTSRELETSGTAVHGQVQRILVDLQFQDRTDQILHALGADILRLSEQLESDTAELQAGAHPPPIDAPAWLSDMERRYTTVEQGDATEVDAGGTAGASSTTFF